MTSKEHGLLIDYVEIVSSNDLTETRQMYANHAIDVLENRWSPVSARLLIITKRQALEVSHHPPSGCRNRSPDESIALETAGQLMGGIT